jgi:PAS domain S-box-containing protein
MSLRLRINLLVTLLMFLFAVAVGRIIVDDTRSSIQEEIEAGTKVTAQMLAATAFVSQLTPAPRQFLLSFLQQLGRVRANHVRLWEEATSSVAYEAPPTTYKAGRYAPAWYAKLVMPNVQPVNIALPGARIEIIPDASRATLDAWDDLTHLLVLGGLFFVVVNVLVFWFVSRSMQPMEDIQRGLALTEAGRLDVRLPAFRLPEFRRISVAFDRMTKALQDAMANSRRLALAVRQSSDAILIHEPDGSISFWNPAAERMFGYSSDEIVGRPLATLAPEPLRDEVIRVLNSVACRQPIDNLLTRRLTKQGVEIDVGISAAAIVDPDLDRVVGGIISHRDVAAQIRAQAAESELRENRDLAQLIRTKVEDERRGIAQELHDELGQCVTAIRTIAQSIVRQTGDALPELHARAQSINDIAARIYDAMHAIVRRLRPPGLDVLGLSETLKETVSAWSARNPRVEFSLELSGDLERLGEATNITVYRLIHEALTNIVRHADASHASIRVARENDAALQVSIRDDGHGQVSMATSAVGFGLIGMRERVESLGGDFIVEGRPGSGTELRAVIPIPAAAYVKLTPTES